MSPSKLSFIALALLAPLAVADTIEGGLHGTGQVIDQTAGVGNGMTIDSQNDPSTMSTATSGGSSASATDSSSGSTITGGINGDACPNNQVNFSNGGSKSYCCPGAVYGDNDNPFCCVGADFEVPRPTFASCFPTCSGTTEDSGVSSTTSQACSTTIYMSESNYSSLAQAAASSLSSEKGGSSGSGSSATGTSDSASSKSTSDSDSDSSSAGGSAASSTNSDSGAAAAMMTSGPMAGALVAAGGFILAL